MPHVVESWQTSYSKRNGTQDHTDLAGFMQAALAILLIWEGFFFSVCCLTLLMMI